MLFNSIEFLLFLPIVLIIFYAVQHKFRVFVLLAASYYFYLSWNPIYILLIFAFTFTDYFAGIFLSNNEKPLSRKLILGFSIILNIGLLVYFKYINFVIENLNVLMYAEDQADEALQVLDVILPVGISFYMFQTLSYTIDVYYKKITAERNLGVFALYVCFFPQLVAGPIERFSSLAPQLKAEAILSKENLSQGFRLILYGFFVKMVIADNIGTLVDSSYGNIEETHSLNLIITAVLYSFQIYCDFHGYSTIAIGTAKLFNVNLIQNFKAPYLSSSLTSFWRSWHISLTTWFRDYIYYPLGGNKEGKLKWVLALVIVFIVSGIWHGANWTFIIWGLMHGTIVLLEKVLGLAKKSSILPLNIIKALVTFTIVTLLWVLFRSPDLDTSLLFYDNLFSNWNLQFEAPPTELLFLLEIFIFIEVVARKSDFATRLNEMHVAQRWGIYFVLAFLILSRSGTDLQPFIYFQF